MRTYLATILLLAIPAFATAQESEQAIVSEIEAAY
jgi:hypothetical protein